MFKVMLQMVGAHTLTFHTVINLSVDTTLLPLSLLLESITQQHHGNSDCGWEQRPTLQAGLGHATVSD